MKKIILSFSLFTCNILFGQDIITTLDSAKIEAKIFEVNTKSISYKKFSNPDGPTYNLMKSDILNVKYQYGEIETYNETVIPNLKEGYVKNSKRKIFIKTTTDSDVIPTLEVWNDEIRHYPQLEKVESIEQADLIFEFKIKRAMGEARVSVDVLDAKSNLVLWESNKYRGTANVYNRMGASLHGIRKCLEKGIIEALNEGRF